MAQWYGQPAIPQQFVGGEQPSQQVMNFFQQQRAQLPPNHPYLAGSINGVPIPKTPGNSIYIVHNENPMGKADPNKVYWKVLGDGTRVYKDRIKQIGAMWMANEKYWGIGTSPDPADQRFMAIVMIANEANQASASRAQYAPQQTIYNMPMQQAAVPYQPAWSQPAAPVQGGLPQALPVLQSIPAVGLPSIPQIQPPQLVVGSTVPTVPQVVSDRSTIQLSHGKVTPISTNEVFVTFRVRIPSIGDRVKIYDTATPNATAFIFVVDSVYDSANGAYKDTFTAKLVEPADRATSDSHVFKIVNGDWALITTSSTVKNTFRTEFL